MALNFPDSPSNGDTVTLNGATYTYNSTKTIWTKNASISLPSQSGNSGKYLTTNGTSASWGAVSSSGGGTPDFTTIPNEQYILSPTGTATTVTVAATDPDGFAISYEHDTNPPNQSQATITNSGGTFTITPSTTIANGGDFTMRFKALDGIYTTHYLSLIHI